MRKNLIISLTISILFIGLIRLQPIWERRLGGFWNILFALAMVILFFWLIVKIIKEIIRIIKLRDKLTFKIFIPIMILLIVLFDGMYNPLKIDLESIYGKVTFRACYEGTQSQSTFTLRDNGKFEIHATGVFFSDEYIIGKYSRNGDTIFMHFDSKTPRLFGDTIIIKDENLFVLKNDILIPNHYYLGYCKGLN
jgi:hypothetical protein